jgi:hypothetical protein
MSKYFLDSMPKKRDIQRALSKGLGINRSMIIRYDNPNKGKVNCIALPQSLPPREGSVVLPPF